MISIIKYIAIVISGIGIGYIITSKPSEVIDNTNYYLDQRDSLEIVIEAKNRMIQNRDKKIADTERKNDSLKAYQNKIYIHYEKKLSDLASIPDSAVYSTFAGLISNR